MKASEQLNKTKKTHRKELKYGLITIIKAVKITDSLISSGQFDLSYLVVNLISPIANEK